jgi:hypothetical protein
VFLQKRLNEAVKRNLKRFPDDFMFSLNREEIGVSSRSQIVTLKRGENIKYAPLAFTEQGIAMLSCVLNSDRAISVNIQIIRIFTKLREMIDTIYLHMKTLIFDFFGAYTYERVDMKRGEFSHTDWIGHGGSTSSSTYNVYLT